MPVFSKRSVSEAAMGKRKLVNSKASQELDDNMPRSAANAR